MITRITNMPLAAIALTSLLSGCGALDENEIVTGDVTISGDALEDSTLTLTQNLVDLNGLGTFRYQWYRDGLAIIGATSKRYTLVYNDVGTDISVTISFTDKQGTAESSSSNVISNIAHVNHPVTGAVVISGDALEDSKLTLTQDLDDADGLGTFNYQWLRDGVPINGATSENYTLAYNDVGTDISVTMSFTDALGAAESSTSNAISNIAHVNHAVTGNVLISGDALEDSTLFISDNLTDVDGLGAFSYQWLRDGVAINGATSESYTLAYADVGADINVNIKFIDALGSVESRSSNVISNIAHVNHAVTGTVVISGDALEDSTLTLTQNLVDADGLGAFSYQWLRDGVPINGATRDRYILDYIDVGTEISATISFTDALGTAESSTSNVIYNIAHVNHPVTGTVLISGDALEDSTLTLTQNLADADGLGSFKYQWYRDGMAINGATNESYTLVYADVGTRIMVAIDFTDALGAAEFSVSNVISNIAHVNHPVTGTVVISGDALEDSTLTLTQDLADADGLGAFSYQWLRDGVAINGATSESYTLAYADVDTDISVTISFTDALDTAESSTSDPISDIAHVNHAVTGTVLINGDALEDSTLTLTQDLADADGLGSFKYQWYRDGMAINGATNESYTLAYIDVGTRIMIAIDFTDALGAAEFSVSNVISNVAHVNHAATGSLTISGDLVEKQTLTVTHDLADSDGLSGAISLQWLSDGVEIEGATSSSYTLLPSDIDSRIHVLASYTDNLGAQEQVSSTSTNEISAKHDVLVMSMGSEITTNTSTDSGVNWSGEVAMFGDKDDGGGYDSAMSSDGKGNIIMVWDTANSTIGGEYYEILFSYSHDDGVTWSDPALLNPADPGLANDDAPNISTNGLGRWIASWTSSEDIASNGSDNDIVYVVSDDNGLTWTNPKSLNHYATSDSASDDRISIRNDGSNNWLATWMGSYDFNSGDGTDWDIFASRSSDNGNTWSEAYIINSNGFSDAESDYSPDLAMDKNGNAVVVWTSKGAVGSAIGTDGDIMAAYSGDYGQNWSSAMVINTYAEIDSNAFDEKASVAMDDIGNAVVVYQSSYDLMNGTQADKDIHEVHSTDFGASWSNSQLLNNNGVDDSIHDWYPIIVTDKQGNWITAWTGIDEYSATSKDGGDNWSDRAVWGDVRGVENSTVIIH